MASTSFAAETHPISEEGGIEAIEKAGQQRSSGVIEYFVLSRFFVEYMVKCISGGAWISLSCLVPITKKQRTSDRGTFLPQAKISLRS